MTTPSAKRGSFLYPQKGLKMAVFRVNKNTNYTVMSNYHFKDKNLSLKAKGLLSQMLSLPDSWDYTVDGLCAINKENKTAMQSTLKELEQNGYLKRTRSQNSKGQFDYIYDIFEEPCTENLVTDDLCTENVSQLNTNKLSTKELSKDNTTTIVVGETPETFGNSDINDLFDEWERVCGYKITSKVKLNRYTCQRLLKSRGKDSILKALPYVAESQSDKYAPNIVNFMDLEEKWNALGVWYKKKYITNFNKNGKITI